MPSQANEMDTYSHAGQVLDGDLPPLVIEIVRVLVFNCEKPAVW